VAVHHQRKTGEASETAKAIAANRSGKVRTRKATAKEREELAASCSV
jgi:hypothetical protein